ncbi:MAG: hypothetical protein ABSE42_12810 [Bryobacteraceae bacterium]
MPARTVVAAPNNIQTAVCTSRSGALRGRGGKWNGYGLASGHNSTGGPGLAAPPASVRLDGSMPAAGSQAGPAWLPVDAASVASFQAR